MAINLSSPPPSLETGHKRRHIASLSNVPLLGRTDLFARIQQVATQTASPSKYPNLMAFFQFWKWIPPYLRDCTRSDAPYKSYTGGETGIFSLARPPEAGTLKIAAAADWGTGTLEAETVAENMARCSPHCTVHLGDVYYVGESGEINENCLGKSTGSYSGVRWPTGSLGSFALMGNHEMYSGGDGYFRTFLSTLGLLNPDKSVRLRQSASYFCLDTGHWLVLGLDTGYHSGGMPGFTSIPGINRIPFLNVDARFDDRMMVWLRETIHNVEADKRPRPILLLTHHQPVSSFEHAFSKPVEQLIKSELFEGREFVWLFGHEHRLVIYEPQVIGGAIKMHPRCIGHGGMPVSLTLVPQSKPEIKFYDPRQHAIDDNDPDSKVGYNGHVVLLFNDGALTIEYLDILGNDLLLSETFVPTAAGALRYSFSRPANSPLVSGNRP